MQGARPALQAALRAAPPRRTRLVAWIVATYERIGYHKKLVTFANKHARLIWVLLNRDVLLRAHEVHCHFCRIDQSSPAATAGLPP